jgi:hypothetical protein
VARRAANRVAAVDRDSVAILAQPSEANVGANLGVWRAGRGLAWIHARATKSVALAGPHVHLE